MSARFEGRRGLRSWWRRASFAEVVTLTLPVFLFAAWLLILPVADYARARQFDDWWSSSAHVHRFAWMRAKTAFDVTRYLAHERRLDPNDPDDSTLRIFVDRAAFDGLAVNVAENMDRWLDADIAYAGRFHPVELRFRGDTSAHWTASKKSLTIKTKRDDLFKGYRRLILTLKEVLPQYTLGRLAHEFDLLAPEQSVVPVFLNDRFYGIYRFVERVDESFLRRSGQLPGNVYRADRAERGEYFKNLPRGVFRDPRLWDRVARNDRPGATGVRALGDFIERLWEARRGDTSPLLERLDTDELARLLALCLIAGDPYHMSAIHNQFWYEEPASGTLHPIVWDLRLLDLGTRPEPLHPLWCAVLREPTVWYRALEEIHDRTRDGALLRRAEDLARTAWRRYEDAFEYDRLRAGIVSDVGHPDEVVRGLAANVGRLREWVDDARAGFGASAEREALTIDLEVRGFAAVELRGFLFEQDSDDRAPVRAPLGARLYADRDRAGAFDPDVDAAHAGVLSRTDDGVSLLLNEPITLYAGVDTRGTLVEPDRIAYRFFMPLETEPGAIPDVRPLCVNAHTGEPVTLSPIPRGTALASSQSRHPWTRSEPETRTVVWSGEVRLTEDVRLDAATTLVIEPGTRLVLAPDVSIKTRGPVDARGSSSRPIRVERADPVRPWGVFALQGPNVATSRLRHVVFDGGGGDLLDEVEYKGMVCVHWGRDVRFESCEFTGNVRCDDGLNVVQSEAVDVDGCRFVEVNADAIDYDYSTGTIQGSTITSSGNDGIDLMSCSPRIIGNVIRGSGDKGISIGEDAAPLVFDDRIERCQRGLEVKDGSEPLILHTEVVDCGLGLLQHTKNWRYGRPGWAKVIASHFEGNETELVQSADARLTALELDDDGADRVLPWLVALAGLRIPAGAAHGRVPSWSERPALRPSLALCFDEDFGDPASGFTFAGGVTRLVTLGRTLEARVRRGRGAIGRPLDVRSTNAAGPAVLLVEYATENLTGLALRTTLEAGGEEPLELTEHGRAFRWATVALELDRVEALIFSFAPGARSDVPGRLILRSVEVFEGDAP